MNNKTLPFVVLIAAALLFFWLKNHQRGKQPGFTVENVKNAYTELRAGNKTLVYSKHARCRMDCRHIDESEVKDILQNGSINVAKEESDERGVTYPVEGNTHDGQHVRIVFAPKEKEIVVVTVIDLGVEWKCNCE